MKSKQYIIGIVIIITIIVIIIIIIIIIYYYYYLLLLSLLLLLNLFVLIYVEWVRRRVSRILCYKIDQRSSLIYRFTLERTVLREKYRISFTYRSKIC